MRPRSMKAAIAVGALALLAVVHLWTIDRLDAFHLAGYRASTAPLARSFKVDDLPARSPLRSGNVGSATTASAGKAPPEALVPVPVVPASRDTASGELQTAPLPYWHSRELILSLASFVVLLGLALAMIVSIARSGVREPVRLLAQVAIQPANLVPELARLAEQTRADAREGVHAMRSPIAILMGYSDALKRSIPTDNVKAWRAVNAMEVATARLNRAVDEVWARADGLASLLQAERESLDLCDLASSIAAEAPNRHIVFPAPALRRVLAPRTSLEKAVRSTFEVFTADSDAASVLAACSQTRSSVRLTVRRDGPLQGEPVDDIGLKRWPDLRETARLVGVLGGQLTARATTSKLQEVVLDFPSEIPA